MREEIDDPRGFVGRSWLVCVLCVCVHEFIKSEGGRRCFFNSCDDDGFWSIVDAAIVNVWTVRIFKLSGLVKQKQMS